MNDPLKHGVGALSSLAFWFGGITIQQADASLSLVCLVCGIIASFCTINSWYVKRKRRKLHEADEAASRARHIARLHKL